MMIFYFFHSILVFAVHVSKNRTASCSFSCSILYPLNITPTLPNCLLASGTSTHPHEPKPIENTKYVESSLRRNCSPQTAIIEPPNVVDKKLVVTSECRDSRSERCSDHSLNVPIRFVKTCKIIGSKIQTRCCKTCHDVTSPCSDNRPRWCRKMLLINPKKIEKECERMGSDFQVKRCCKTCHDLNTKVNDLKHRVETQPYDLNTKVKMKLRRKNSTQTVMKFSVDDVELGPRITTNDITNETHAHAWTNCLKPPNHHHEANAKKFSLEQSSSLPTNTVNLDFHKKNLFVESALLAYKSHYPLKITPDVVWITIMQGFAKHINQNAERYRSEFVAHESKKEIVIRVDDFVKGAVNEWPKTFSFFCEKIEENLVNPEIRKLIDVEFSTTSKVDKMVGQIALMDTVKNYFELTMVTSCGIPDIELAGDIDDWIKLRQDAEALLSKFELQFWSQHLLPILDRFVSAFKGDIDTKFWGSIAKLHSRAGSGPTYLNGWIQDFFPYIRTRRNPHLGSWRAEFEKVPGSDDEDLKRYYQTGGLNYNAVPIGLNTAPFQWKYYNQSFKMHLVGAISAIVQDPESLQVEAVTGWGILEEK